MPHDIRDLIVDFVRYWTQQTEIPGIRFIIWLKLSSSKYYNWRERYGKANIETLKDSTGLQWGAGYSSNTTTPAMEAWKALGKIGKPAIVPVIAALKDKDADIRFGATEALGEIGDQMATEALIQILNDHDDRTLIKDGHNLTFEIRGELAQLLRPEMREKPSPNK